MWLVFAFGSALFAGLTSILAKCGIKKTDSDVATGIRTIIVLLFSWLMVFIVGSQNQISAIDGKTLLFLILSGLATGASWLCYFKALQIGDINKVVPIDKSSTIITIILAAIILGESITLVKGVAIVLIAVGTFLMIEKKKSTNSENKSSWLLFAFGSALFAALTAILGKIGISGVESNLGTAIRTFVVLIMSWVMVLVTGKKDKVKEVPKNELISFNMNYKMEKMYRQKEDNPEGLSSFLYYQTFFPIIKERRLLSTLRLFCERLLHSWRRVLFLQLSIPVQQSFRYRSYQG